MDFGVPVLPNISDPSIVLKRDKRVQEVVEQPVLNDKTIEYIDQNDLDQDKNPVEQKSNKIFGIDKKLILFLMAGIVIIIILVLIYYYFFYKSSGPSGQNTGPPAGSDMKNRRGMGASPVGRQSSTNMPADRREDQQHNIIDQHNQNLAATSVDELDKLINNSSSEGDRKVEGDRKAEDNEEIDQKEISDALMKQWNIEEGESYLKDRTLGDNESAKFDELIDKKLEEEGEDPAPTSSIEEQIKLIEEDVKEAEESKNNFEETKAICGAINKTTGKPCERKPSAGGQYCQWHKSRGK